MFKLKKPVTFSDSVKPVCLPFASDTIPVVGEIIGFGMTEKRGGRLNSRVLMKANVNILDHLKCQELSKDVHNKSINENHLCAQDKKTITNKKGVVETVTVDTCKGKKKLILKSQEIIQKINFLGDSGSPLLSIQKLDIARYTQVGITSWGQSGCGTNKTAPGVYAKISSYLDWILDQAD